MLTNKDFELSSEQLQIYHDWITALNQRRNELPLDEWFASAEDVEIVFTFSCVGRGVVARIPSSKAEVVMQDLY